VYLYANRRIASIRDYRITITADEPIKFWIDTINSLGSNYIIKIFSFFLYVSYEWRYSDAKFESGNFLLRNVVIIVIIVIVDPSCVVWLQLLTQEALMIKSNSDVGMYVSRSRMSERENGKAESEWESEWENKQESERYSAMLLSVRPNVLYTFYAFHLYIIQYLVIRWQYRLSLFVVNNNKPNETNSSF